MMRAVFSKPRGTLDVVSQPITLSICTHLQYYLIDNLIDNLHGLEPMKLLTHS